MTRAFYLWRRGYQIVVRKTLHEVLFARLVVVK